MAEVAAAIDGGADIVDIKETTKGSLGAAHPQVWADVAQDLSCRLDGQSVWSVAMGELQDPARSPKEFGLVPAFAKVGLAGLASSDSWRELWSHWRYSLPDRTHPVAVVYADRSTARTPCVNEILATGKQIGCRVMLVDTFSKGGGGLLDHVTLEELDRWCELAREASMRVALAGSLNAETISEVLELRPDWIAVRGAVCNGDRNGVICCDKVREIHSAIEQRWVALGCHSTP